MNKEELQAFLARPNDAVIAANRPGKGAQLTPVWFLWDGESFIFSTQKATAKYLNIKRDPNISVIVNEEHQGYVAAHGQAQILESGNVSPEQMGKMLEKYVPAEQREQFLAAVQSAQTSERIIIKLRPEKIVSFSTAAAYSSAAD
jgi:PPOX class probable F420-dependent enzyme